MLRRAVLGTLPKEPTNHQAVAMAVLVNAGLVELGLAPARTSQAPRVPADDVRFSLLLEEEIPARPEKEGRHLPAAVGGG